MSHGFGSGPATIGRGAVGLSVTRGSGSPGGDDLHLGLSSHELGLGSNFGLDAPDNVLSRAARVGTSPISPGMGTRLDDRPSLQGLDLGMPGKGQHSPQRPTGSPTGGDGSKGNIFKKDEKHIERSSAIEEQELELEQSQL